jgi:hypothetical protein
MLQHEVDKHSLDRRQQQIPTLGKTLLQQGQRQRAPAKARGVPRKIIRGSWSCSSICPSQPSA